MGRGGPHADWQNVELSWDDLVAGVGRFKRDLVRLLESAGPPALPSEWTKRLSALA